MTDLDTITFNLKTLSWFNPNEKKKDEHTLSEEYHKAWKIGSEGLYVLARVKDFFLFFFKVPNGFKHHYVLYDPSASRFRTSALTHPYISVVHLVRDLIDYEVSLLPKDNPRPVNSYREILRNNPITRVFAVSDVCREPIAGLFAAVRANTWSQEIRVSSAMFLGRVDDITQNNFSLLSIRTKFAELEESATNDLIQIRNSEMRELTNVFELCEGSNFLISEAWNSLLSFTANREKLEKSALYFACGRGHTALVGILIANKHNELLKMMNTPHPVTQETPLLLAIRNKRFDTIHFIEGFLPNGNLIGWHGNIDRKSVELILANTPAGTFLTRYSENARSYIISHVLQDSTIQHIANITKEQGDRVKVVMTSGTFYYNTFPQFVYECIQNKAMWVTYPINAVTAFAAEHRENPLRRSLRSSADQQEDTTAMRLIECGFEEEKVRKALRESGGSFDISLGILHIEEDQTTGGMNEEQIKQILALGFTRTQAINALKLKHDLVHAVDHLFNEREKNNNNMK